MTISTVTHRTASSGYSPSPGGSRLAPEAAVHPGGKVDLWAQRCSEPSRRWCSWCHCPPQGRVSKASAWCHPAVWPAGCCLEAAPRPRQPESGTRGIWVRCGNRRCPADTVCRTCADKAGPWQRRRAAPDTQDTPEGPEGPTHPSSSSSPRETLHATLRVAHVTSMSDAALGAPGQRKKRQKSVIVWGKGAEESQEPKSTQKYCLWRA